ncbi:AGAP003080-PA [Anopheles gambiae str. PEST]|uniref:AGAP003080-PA n=1 Tax=Anopheles gambiae TaxID=7165 RepID=A0NDC5_ANOGA|nr:AGAP003080-PA [Anopheles gambiae str. PEST]
MKTTFKDFPSPDIARSLTGPDILQKHSINSLLLEHNEIISRGLPSPIDADLLGGSQASSPTSATSSVGKGGDGSLSSSTGLAHHHHHQLQHNQQHLQQQQGQQNHQHHHHQHHHTTLGSFASSLGSSLAGSSVARPTTVCDDSGSSILSCSGGGNSSASGGSVSSNPFNFSSLRIPSPSLNSPDLLMGGGVLIGGGIAGSSSSSSSSSSGISCGGAGSAGSGQSPTTHSFYTALQQQQQQQPGSGGSSGNTADALPSSSGNGGGAGGFEGFRVRKHVYYLAIISPSLTLLCSNSGRNYRNGSSSYSHSQQNALSHHQQQSSTVSSVQQQQYDLLSGSNGSASGINGPAGGGAGGNGITSNNNHLGSGMGSFDSANSGTTNSSALSLFGSGNGSLSRSHSPPDHSDTSNLLTSLESTSILDMLNYLTLGQSTNSVPTTSGLHNQTSQHQQSNGGQLAPYTSTLNTLYQQQQQQQQHQQPTAASGSFAGSNAASNNGNTVGLSGLSLGSTGFATSEYDRLQNLQALNTLRLLQQTQQLSQLQQLQFNQSLLPAATGNGGASIFGNCGAGTAAGSISTSGNNALTASGSIGSNMGCTGGNNGNNSMQGKSWSSSQQHMVVSHRQGSSSPSLNGGSAGNGNGYNDINLDRIARFHRSSAAHYDATCTWSGVLPPRSSRLVTYSSKIFLGGMPWDISEQSLVQIFKPFGSIKVEWPGKEQQATQPKGYVYIIFESDKQVKALLQSCTYTTPNGGMHVHHGGAGPGNYGGSHTAVNGASSNGSVARAAGANYDEAPPHQHQQSHRQQVLPMSNLNKPLAPSGAKINFKISSKRIKSKDVEVIPWNIADSNYVKSASQKLDPTKTVFVGALHGQLTAEGLAKIMNDLFDGVVYVGIDTDKYKYPLGSARVTFNNSRSYMKAVSAAFIEIRTSKFTKKLQVDPYLEDSLCSMCTVQHGPYFCREIMCFRYFCRSCWQLQHSREVYLQNHKPLTRNSKFTAIIGVGPQQHQQQSHTSGGSNGSNGNHHLHQQQSSFDHSPYYSNHHHHHHHHHHGGSGRDSLSQQSGSSLSSHNHQYHHHNNHHHQQQQQQGSRLSLLQQQQHHHHNHHRGLAKSPSPSMCNGAEGNNNGIGCGGNTSNTSSNSSSPIGVGTSGRSINASSTSSSSCSSNSLNGSNNNVNCSAGTAGGSTSSGEHVSLNLQQLSFVAGGGGTGGSDGLSGSSNGNGGSGMLI